MDDPAHDGRLEVLERQATERERLFALPGADDRDSLATALAEIACHDAEMLRRGEAFKAAWMQNPPLCEGCGQPIDEPLAAEMVWIPIRAADGWIKDRIEFVVHGHGSRNFKPCVDRAWALHSAPEARRRGMDAPA